MLNIGSEGVPVWWSAFEGSLGGLYSQWTVMQKSAVINMEAQGLAGDISNEGQG
jgi:hypothetical protein